MPRSFAQTRVAYSFPASAKAKPPGCRQIPHGERNGPHRRPARLKTRVGRQTVRRSRACPSTRKPFPLARRPPPDAGHSHPSFRFDVHGQGRTNLDIARDRPYKRVPIRIGLKVRQNRPNFLPRRIDLNFPSKFFHHCRTNTPSVSAPRSPTAT